MDIDTLNEVLECANQYEIISIKDEELLN